MNATDLTATDLFCGGGGSSVGAAFAGVSLRLGLNHWLRAIETHSANFPDAEHDCEDISSLTTAQIRRYPDSDLLLASPECFPAGSLVLLRRGLVPIEEVDVSDEALTHEGRWRRVTRVQSRRADTVFVKGQGHTPGVEVTPSHRFWMRASGLFWRNDIRQYRRHHDAADWLPVSEAIPAEAYWSTPVEVEETSWVDPPVGFGADSEIAWWLVGRWLGDGSLGKDRHTDVVITAGFQDVAEVRAVLAKTEANWRYRDSRTAGLFELSSVELWRWLRKNFGSGAAEKGIPGWSLGMPEALRRQLLAGYLSADGHTAKRRVQIDTVSKKLAIGMRMLAEGLGHRTGLHCYEQRANVIEGRKVNVRPLWKIAWEKTATQRYSFEDGKHAWSRVKEVLPGREDIEVFNIEVEEDHSYVADGIVVKNCTNHSLAKGARRRKPQAASLFDDGPAGDDEQDRSRATMWDVVRFAEQKLIKGRPYKAVIVENVVDAYRWGWNDDGGLFSAWLSAMHALGYRHEIVWLNSMFCPPTPQSRDRMYVVFWRKEMRSPNLRMEPLSWCPSCERIVEGRQTWKRVDRPLWGRYGAQYYFACPECRTTVLPGVHPAALVIDDSIPAPLIGERPRPLASNTRERIRRGLERLASEPFAIRLLHGNAPKPLTLPLVTLTQRHDMAMVLPVGGNSYETTPGNRARDAERQPLSTLAASGGRALVYSNRMHNVPRPAEREPSHPVLTGGHLGVVVANYSPGWARRAGEHPIGSITTQDGHSFVVPCRRTGRASRPHREPFSTVDTRDRFALVVPPIADETVSDPITVTDEEIDECRFRMFTLPEIAGAMAMDLHYTGEPYIVVGNKREQMAQFGNAVTPPAMRWLIERVVPIFDEAGAT